MNILAHGHKDAMVEDSAMSVSQWLIPSYTLVILKRPKIDELKPINHKEFNKFIKGRGLTERNYYTLKDQKAKFGFKPLVERKVLVVSSEGMEPSMFGSIREGR